MTAIHSLYQDLSDEHDSTGLVVIKSVLHFLALVAYSFAGAYVFYVLEATDLVSTRFLEFREQCQAIGYNHSYLATYWDAVYYANTLYTTVGYGSSTVCCTNACRALTMVYVIIGVPFVLVILDALGGMFLVLSANVWSLITKTCCICCSRKTRSRRSFSCTMHAYANLHSVPLWFGIVLTISWTLICSVVFYCVDFIKQDSLVDQNQYFLSFYFAVISLTTVGLGDIDLLKHENTIGYFALIFVGMSMVSMCIHLVQQKLGHLFKTVIENINKQYQEKMLQDGTAASAMVTDLKTARERVRKMYEGSWRGKVLSKLLTKEQKTELVKHFLYRANMNVVGTQTEPLTVDVEVQVKPDTRSVRV